MTFDSRSPTIWPEGQDDVTDVGWLTSGGSCRGVYAYCLNFQPVSVH